MTDAPREGDQSAAVPVCPRHPDRVSYVRCQRCGRPTCPQCQREAPVGVQCVDCVAQAAKTTRQARTVFGGRVTPDRRPLVTWTMMAICLLGFMAQQAVPDVYGRFAYAPVLTGQEPWRMLTATYLHANLLHLAFNLYALYLIGPYLEDLLGRWRFTALYLVTAFGGSVGYLLLSDPLSLQGVVGASGAVFGLFGALVIVQRKLRRDLRQIAVILGLNFAVGFVLPNVAWEAHLGGLVVGLALGAVFAYAPRKHRSLAGVAAVAVVSAVLVAGTVLVAA